MLSDWYWNRLTLHPSWSVMISSVWLISEQAYSALCVHCNKCLCVGVFVRVCVFMCVCAAVLSLRLVRVYSKHGCSPRLLWDHQSSAHTPSLSVPHHTHTHPRTHTHTHIHVHARTSTHVQFSRLPRAKGKHYCVLRREEGGGETEELLLRAGERMKRGEELSQWRSRLSNHTLHVKPGCSILTCAVIFYNVLFFFFYI